MLGENEGRTLSLHLAVARSFRRLPGRGWSLDPELELVQVGEAVPR